MSNTLQRVAAQVLNKPLLCSPEYAETMIGALGERIGVDNFDLSAASFNTRDKSAVDSSEVAIVPIIGSLVHRGGFMEALSGARSYQAIAAELSGLADDPSVHTIVLEVDSPGGLVSGVFDLADKIKAISSRKDKRVIAYVNDMAASAAYLLACCANRVVISQTAEVGHIGAVYAHVDRSKALENAGLKPTFIYRGAHKIDGRSEIPLSEAAAEKIQDSIDEIYMKFVGHVASMRGLSEETVMATEALTFSGQKAIDAGLADQVGTLEDVIEMAERLSKDSRNIATMTKETLFTQAQLDEAVAKASADAEAKISAAADKAASSALERVNAIMGSEHWEGREELGKSMIANTKLTAEEVVGMLALSPKKEAAAPAATAPAPVADAGAAQKAALEALASENPEIGPDASAGTEASAETPKDANGVDKDAVKAASSFFKSRKGL